ncbi:hypothetical protein PMAYCL1PPCAC_07263 [Pristionchus mayeri]|uniref:Alanine--glyoxylate aminotransferase n=1 Tax=Pristionchus mayeri TaxID=1317129 RepID=A0AAN5C4K3_9BILA|nr:hypothetical protein PMAYCL1PPCAC_07263 [Pristionchus mayeri]
MIARRFLSFHQRVFTSSLRVMSSIPPPECLFKDINIPNRQLFGPGPSTMPQVIGSTQAQPLLGHLHPEFVEIMSQVRLGLQYVFKTRNAYTLAVSGTGHAGMEAAILNLAERGETLLVAKAGIWGQRAADLGRRLGLKVEVVEVGDGQIVPLSAIEEAATRVKPAVIFVCHGESSTGIAQPLEGLSKIAHDNGGLLLVDTVASLGGAPFDMDALGVDCVYSATQKVLNAPPGLAPISFSDRAIQKIKKRKERVASFYFDALELGNYWGCDGEMRRYHHTAPISTVYALREALAIIAKKGIDTLIQQHLDTATGLYSQLGEAGLSMFVERKEDRLPCLHTVKVPEGVDWKGVQTALFQQGIEFAGGLGATTGKIFRIGTFGQNSEPEKAKEVVNKFIQVVKEQSKL